MATVWPRHRVETMLSTGGLGKRLAGVERVTARRVRSRRPGAGDRFRVTFDGDDGRRYVRRYAPARRGSGLRLAREDPRLRDLPPTVLASLDRSAAAALAELDPTVAR